MNTGLCSFLQSLNTVSSQPSVLEAFRSLPMTASESAASEAASPLPRFAA